MTDLYCRIKDYIQPFERQLALSELGALIDGDAKPVDGTNATASTFAIREDADIRMLCGSLAYWQSIGATEKLTTQLRCEATSLTGSIVHANDIRYKERSEHEHMRIPRRRCLRYATHGMHEYRGKFFPQLVRALINIAGVPEHGIVFDPMCGSGTTLVEARLAGRKTYGLDLNPLSVYVARVKCQSLTLSPALLVDTHDALQQALAQRSSYSTESYFASLPRGDREYLSRWFASGVLEELDGIQAAIAQCVTEELRDFYTVVLSNILRTVSWQKDSDLRVRRDEQPVQRGEVIARFLKEAERSTRVVGAFLRERGDQDIGDYSIQQGDARRAIGELPHIVGQVDTIITSPPYATALPYIDTDRLSLTYLGLLPRQDHRLLDREMIGNREVAAKDHASYWEAYETGQGLLPSKTCALIDKIDQLNKTHSVGFRRRNLAALLAKYFLDMVDVLKGMQRLLRPGGTAILVVGNNRTTAGNQPVEIGTADHLTAIAERSGFDVVNRLPMEMLTSRDIFRKNAMSSEQIVTLRRC